ncbi:MAG: 30S ribosomal protein S18 [Candidatus Omnitrophota bacterium]|nr:30S ribosomal protein S18 [Candidatus Omnitrophota bacterium]MBU2035215.1 30S ribosomal protein S18 [Candidatus Omnitrophota bacterium]MBU2257811.1 30S ribosomal protein S18 [Candidatus Omnitrophota bacterium]
MKAKTSGGSKGGPRGAKGAKGARGPRGRSSRKSGMSSFFRRRVCRFCTDKVKVIDYKDLKTMESFVKERGRIVSSRGSGNCAKHQRQISNAIKIARFMALIPYCTYK